MKLLMYCVYDAKVQVFAPPMYVRTLGEVTRLMQDTLAGGDSTLSRHPADFHLYALGQYDQSTATFELSTPSSLGTLAQFMPEARKAPLLEMMHGGKNGMGAL